MNAPVPAPSRGARRLTKIKGAGFRAGMVTLERLSIYRCSEMLPSTIWIVGPPRSGTTLLYQLLIQRYRLSYLCNFAARHFYAPVTATRIAKRLFTRESMSTPYQSDYGKSSHPLGPSEAGEFWYRWFPRGDHVYTPSGGLSLAQLTELKREVTALAALDDAPALFKNTYNSMRIGPIVDAFPDACFLVSRRAPVNTAQSILKGRIEQKKSKEEWWSLPPKEIDSIRRLSYCEQVVAQVYYTYRQIEEDRVRFGPNRFLDVSYEGLCGNTHASLAQIEAFLHEQEIKVEARASVPSSFPMSQQVIIESEDYRCIQRNVSALWT